MNILIVDDHRLFRQIFADLISSIKDGQTHQACDGNQALEILKITPMDIVFLDVHMPGMNGYEAIREIRKLYPGLKVILLTQFYEREVVSYFLQWKVSGFMTKGADKGELVSVFSSIEAGKNYFSHEILEDLKDWLHEIGPLSNKLRFSPKEKEIIRLLYKGLTSKELAASMNLDVKTINSYRENLMTKTRTRNVAELISFSTRTGMI